MQVGGDIAEVAKHLKKSVDRPIDVDGIQTLLYLSEWENHTRILSFQDSTLESVSFCLSCATANLFFVPTQKKKSAYPMHPIHFSLFSSILERRTATGFPLSI